MENYKVLMALMKLDLGGAETHLIELSKGLKEKGLEVIVATNGGQYVKELEENGIEHITVPLHNKSPLNLIKSYFLLKKIIIDRDIKLVHSHARIPSFIVGLLKMSMDFRFVTTAHLNFKTTFPFNILSNWGEHSLAVSSDVKEYLMNNYRYPSEKILTTVNGIDVNRYKNAPKGQTLKNEFGLKDEKTIVYMSRMDSDRSLPAHILCEIGENLYNSLGNIKILIVGDGNDLKNIRVKAQRVNDKLDYKLFVITGARTDTDRVIGLGDFFIGVSRSALEAMACEKPTILAGNQGYLGIFDEDKLEQSINSNFCCRDTEDITPELLQRDIQHLFSKPKNELELLGKYSRDIVKERYSINRMVDDTLALYESVRYSNRPIQVLISGYYGFKNNGDDILLKSIIDNLRKIDETLEIVVLSKTPKETEKDYNVRAINRFNFFSIISTLKKTNLLLSGGGTLVQDLTSSNSLYYYLTLINFGNKYGAKTMLYSNGIGPIKREKNRRFARKILEKVDLITLRDSDAYNELKNLGISNENVFTTVDPAFGIENSEVLERSFLKKEISGFDITKDYYCVSVRNWKYLQENFVDEMSKFINSTYEKYGLIPIFISMQPTNDTYISNRILDNINCEGYLFKENYELKEIMSLIHHSKFVVGMRLHTIIYGIKCNRPVLGLVYDPKVEGIMNLINEKTFRDVTNLNGNELIEDLSYIMENEEIIINNLKEFNIVAKEKALESPKAAIDIVKRKLF